MPGGGGAGEDQRQLAVAPGRAINKNPAEAGSVYLRFNRSMQLEPGSHVHPWHSAHSAHAVVVTAGAGAILLFHQLGYRGIGG